MLKHQWNLFDNPREKYKNNTDLRKGVKKYPEDGGERKRVTTSLLIFWGKYIYRSLNA